MRKERRVVEREWERRSYLVNHLFSFHQNEFLEANFRNYEWWEERTEKLSSEPQFYNFHLEQKQFQQQNKFKIMFQRCGDCQEIMTLEGFIWRGFQWWKSFIFLFTVSNKIKLNRFVGEKMQKTICSGKKLSVENWLYNNFWKLVNIL